MGNLKTPYLVTHKNKNGSQRHYFAPRQQDRRKGWATVRLHDAQGRKIRDPIAATIACKAVAEIYVAWRRGQAGMGPHLIDQLGRVVKAKSKAMAKLQAAPSLKVYSPGQIGAMIADYKEHDVYLEDIGDKTRLEYSTYLAFFENGRVNPEDPTFGETYWWELAPGPLRTWLQAHGRANGWAGAHSLYRTIRAFFTKVRLVYKTTHHPGYVPIEKNPAAKLDLGLPKPSLILWPRAAVDAFVALADERGHASIGDAIVMMGWLGVRKQDWLEWHVDVFERELLAFKQEKTDKPLVLPWRMVPALAQRIDAASERRKARAVASTTFFHDSDGRPWKDADGFRDAFNGLRNELVKTHPAFPTRYYAGLDPADPLSLPTAKLTMRTMRHTCITLNHDAGVPRELIRAITGHELDTIDQVLKCYAAVTADQAAMALNIRLAHEATG